MRLDSISDKIGNLLLFLNHLLKWSKNQIQLGPVQMTSFKTLNNLTKIMKSLEKLQKEKKYLP
jgi:hypothetical protein